MRYRLSVLYELSFVIVAGSAGLYCEVFGDGVGRWIGLGLLLVAAVFAGETWRKLRWRLHLHTGGLVITRKGVVRERVRWDDVAHVRAWTTRIYKLDGFEDLYRCVLVLRNGRRVNLARPPYAKGEQLCEYIVERMAEAVYPRKTEELASTGQTSFGRILVTEDGVGDGRRFAAWPAITRVRHGRVRLRIWTSGRRPVISRQIRTIPDVTVLLRMLRGQSPE